MTELDNKNMGAAFVGGAIIMALTNSLNPLFAAYIRPLWFACILSFLSASAGVKRPETPSIGAWAQVAIQYVFASLVLFSTATGTNTLRALPGDLATGAAPAVVSALWPSTASAADVTEQEAAEAKEIVKLCERNTTGIDPAVCIEAERTRRAVIREAAKTRREEQQKGAFPPKW